MKMRKLFAGIAAAATLLGGMALGAASAQADDASTTAGSGTPVIKDAEFKFTAQDAKQLTNRKLNAYKIADYVQYGTGSDAMYGVQTAGTVTDKSVIKAALEAAVKGTAKSVPTDGSDLMAWALAEGVLDTTESSKDTATGAWKNGASRKFVETLKTKTNMLGDPTVVDLGKNLAKDGLSATVTLPAGLYLFVDADYSAGTNKDATPSIAILVGSGNVENGVLNPLTKATVDIKNQTTTVSKTVSAATASVGQTVTYTITSKVPQNTQYYSDYAYTYTDTPSAGQTVNLNSLKVKVANAELKKDTDYTVTEGENGKFTVNITSIKRQNAGDEIVVTYDAEVTEAEATGRKAVTNTVVLSDNGAEATDSTSITNSEFSFTKTDAQGNPLAGATFTINVPGVKTPFTATSGENGKVTFKGLADGTYTVNETTVPAGFQQNLKATFTVTIKDGETTFAGTDVWGLAPKNSSADYKVKNVKNVTQLPLTGAAGTTLFTVVALLVAGAGVTVAVKSRQRMH